MERYLEVRLITSSVEGIITLGIVSTQGENVNDQSFILDPIIILRQIYPQDIVDNPGIMSYNIPSLNDYFNNVNWNIEFIDHILFGTYFPGQGFENVINNMLGSIQLYIVDLHMQPNESEPTQDDFIHSWITDYLDFSIQINDMELTLFANEVLDPMDS